jgi:hypothetical protein
MRGVTLLEVSCTLPLQVFSEKTDSLRGSIWPKEMISQDHRFVVGGFGVASAGI